MELVIGIVFFVLVIYLLPGSSKIAPVETCTRGHKWSWVPQDGVYNEDGEQVEILFCSKCKRSANEIINI